MISEAEQHCDDDVVVDERAKLARTTSLTLSYNITQQLQQPTHADERTCIPQRHGRIKRDQKVCSYEFTIDDDTRVGANVF